MSAEIWVLAVFVIAINVIACSVLGLFDRFTQKRDRCPSCGSQHHTECNAPTTSGGGSANTKPEGGDRFDLAQSDPTRRRTTSELKTHDQ